MKKVFSLLLALALTLTMGLSAMAAPTFSDMPNDWSTPGLQAAVDNGLLNGDNGKIMPYDNMTRAQMATIMVRAFGATVVTDISRYADVQPSDWFYDSMRKAVAMGALSGKSATTLNPNDPITRQEVCVVLNRLFNLPQADKSVLNAFVDKDMVASWATDGVAALVAAGYMNGANGYLNPINNITRAEFATIMNRMVAQYITEPGSYTNANLKDGNIVIRCGNVTFQGVKSDDMIIVADGAGVSPVSFFDVELSHILLIRGGNNIDLLGQFGDIIFKVDNTAILYSDLQVPCYRTIQGSGNTEIIVQDPATAGITGGDQ